MIKKQPGVAMDLSHCTICPNACGIDRYRTVGLCHMPAEARVCRIALHTGEEPIISGNRGSGTIFFAGCSLQCCFCQNYEISHFPVGRTYTAESLAEAMRQLVLQGAHNINFVNPTHYAHILKQALTIDRPPVPIVYNCGGYERPETLRELDGFIDVYLPDLKFLSSTLAARYTGRENYPTFAKAAIDEMVRQTGAPVLQDGILVRGVIVRHLVLPGCSDEGVRVMEYLTQRYGDGIYISAMSQYTPHGDLSGAPELRRRLLPIEYKRVTAALRRAGQQNCFVQDFTSSDEKYIPAFDLK